MKDYSNSYYKSSQMPNQRVSDNEKQQKRWYIPMADYIAKQCESNNDKNNILTYYNIANGVIKESDYTHITNPYHAQNPKLKQFPAKLRNHDIVQPILLRFVGEYIKSNFRPIVGINNADVQSKKIEAKLEYIKPYLNQIIADTLAKYDMSTGLQPSKNDDSIEQAETAEREFDVNWKDDRAIKGQQVISYLRDELDLDIKYLTAYIDWLISGQYYSYTTVKYDKVYHEIISPLEYYPILNGTEYIEDTNMGMRLYHMDINDIISKFRDDLSDKDIKYIEELIRLGEDNVSVTNAIVSDRYGNAYEYFKNKYGETDFNVEVLNKNGIIEVRHFIWTTQVPIQILVYQTQLGELKRREVDIDYKLNRDIGDLHLEKEWTNEVWDMYRFGDEALGLYTIPKSVITQRHEVNNTANVKNPYGGKAYMFQNLLNPSIVKVLAPYQVIYNIIHYHRELAIANNIGKILVIPKGILVDDDEISQEEAIYYIKADKKLYLDETSDNFASAVQGLKQIDASDAEYINGLGQILISIKEEAWESVGMNRQRYGDTYASDGKATTEQAIYRASIGSAPITEVFNSARLKDYMGLIDNAKVAYISDDEMLPLGSYITDDGRVDYLTIYPQEFLESNIGLYIANYSRDKEKIEQYKQTAFAAAQNGAFEVGLEAIEFENPHKLKESLKEWRALEDKREQQKAEEQRKLAEMAQQKEEQRFAIEQETLRYVADIKAKATVDAAAVRVEVTALQQDGIAADRESKERIEEAKTTSKERTDKYKADKQHLTALQNTIKNRTKNK